MRRIVLLALSGLCLGGVVFSYLGAWHPAGDLVAIAAPALGFFGLTAALMLWGRLGQALALIFLVWLGQQAWALMAPTGPQGDFVIYQKNLWYRNAELPALAADILASEADVVTLQEISRHNDSILDLLAPRYPHQHRCVSSNWINVAVLSRHPIVAGSEVCSARRALGAMQVETRQGPVWVASVHLTWPYPYNQAERLRMIEPMLAALQGPTVIGADLNTFPATRPSRRIARLSDTRELRPLRPTLWLRGLPMFIDQVYASSGTVERRPLLGSDHYGLLARVTP